MANTITTGKANPGPFNISNIIGVDVSDKYPVYAIPGSSATQTNLYYPETNQPPFSLGTHVKGTLNTEFVMCVVGTAGSINQYDVVAIDSNYNVQQASSAIGLPSVGAFMVGFNQGPGLAGSQASVTVNFCWIAIRGDTLNVNTNAAVTALSGQNLYVGTAPGTIGTASASTLLVAMLNNAASVTAATTMAVISGPAPFFTLTTGLGT